MMGGLLNARWPQRILALPWRMILTISLIGAFAVVVLYSAAGGSMTPWALNHAVRFTIFLGAAILISQVPLRFWLNIAYPLYGVVLVALIGGLLAGVVAYALQQPKLPRWLAGMMPVVIIPLVATIVSSGLMFLVLGRPIAWVMTALNDFLVSMSGASALVLGLILGAMMGADLGGPINKTAYLFATAGLSAGTLVSQEIMGAVIAAGMATPLGMALATTLRKKYFTEAEINNGRAAWLLGASFISEGAIPFAAADPLRVIPSSIVGSAVTGAICMSTGVASQAPHGGIWILPVVSNPGMYLVAVIVGMLITAAMYLLLKRIGNTRTGAEKAKAAQVA